MLNTRDSVQKCAINKVHIKPIIYFTAETIVVSMLFKKINTPLLIKESISTLV